MPLGISLSYMFPTVGQDVRPVVVSDSPHLVETQRSETLHSSRLSSDAHWTNSLALREAAAMVLISPFCSIQKPSTGFPVLRIPSTTRWVQPGSMPITITAATLGFEPVP